MCCLSTPCNLTSIIFYRLRELLQYGDVDGRWRRRRHGRRRSGWRRRWRGSVPVHCTAEPVQHVPRRALPRYVLVHSVAAAEGKAALWVRGELRVSVAGVARGFGAVVGVPIRGWRVGTALRVGPR